MGVDTQSIASIILSSISYIIPTKSLNNTETAIGKKECTIFLEIIKIKGK